MSITQEELLAALSQAVRGSAPADAKTADQLSQEMRVPRSTVMKALRVLAGSGRVQHHRVPRIGIDGRNVMVPAYTISAP